MILRPNYVEKIKKLINVDLIKILVGVRRSGKSTILEMIKKELIDNHSIDKSNIISRRYTDTKYIDFKEVDMEKDITTNLKNNNKYYLFLDEIQEIPNWERAINTIFENYNVDIYVTGSNSKLTSSEISTYLTGRYIQIPVYTLSFKEYLTFQNSNEDRYTVFDKYIKYGGFPLVSQSNFDYTSAYQVVDGIYSSIITRDISKRYNVRDLDLFDRVVRYIIENVGKTFSANSVIKFLKGEGRKISNETIYNYIKWLSDAFIIYKCDRFDLQGRQVLKTFEKYYFSDISFKYSKFGFNPTMISPILENIVYLEIKRRGYNTYIGKLGDKEIDFVGKKQDAVIYIQVCRMLPEKSNREIENLKSIKDNHPKYVVTMDKLATGNIDGINIVNIVDFLLNDNW